MTLDHTQVRKLIRLAIEEDFGTGDPTTQLTVADTHIADAVVVAREALVFCGGPLVSLIFEEFGWEVEIEVLVDEGIAVAAGTELVRLRGSAAALLAAERTLLNFLQRLSGVASYTRNFVSAEPKITVLDTRKTLPGWRRLEKYATRTGGATNHRQHLGDMILVKNNHIDAQGGDVDKTLGKIFADKTHDLEVEVEVRSEEELRAVLEFPVDMVMLDNMDDQAIAACLALLNESPRKPRVEVSGGITAARLPELSALGVTCVSSGSLTTQATNVDIAMRIML